MNVASPQFGQMSACFLGLRSSVAWTTATGFEMAVRLGFDAAMVRVARNGKGPLAQELIRTLQDIQVGRPRRMAYSDLAERTQVKDLGRFVRAIAR